MSKKLCKMRIKNFGAIRNGYKDSKDGFFLISRFTVFIGSQGAGKSTIIKLLSTFLWLEKALVRGDLLESDITIEKFENNYLAYHCMKSYATDNYEIEYIGTRYSFCIKKKEKICKICDNKESSYTKPKIAYILAERNLCSAIPNLNAISGILRNLFDMIGDFDIAREALNNKEYRLPLGDFYYKYDVGNKKSFIFNSNKDYNVELFESASGIQSVVPLSLITTYFSDFMQNKFDEKRQFLSLDEKKQIKKIYDNLVATLGISCGSSIIASVLTGTLSLGFSVLGLISAFSAIGIVKSLNNNQKNNKITTEQKKILQDANNKLQSIINSRFINIVEEPEQNLFPDSQIKVVEMLVKSLNSSETNCLFMSTHSPFVLSALNNLIYANKISSKNIGKNLQLSGNECSAYRVENGNIVNVFNSEFGIIDTGLIDDCATLLNKQYDTLYNEEGKNE